MKRWLKAGVWSAIFTALVAGVLWYLFLPALNVKSVGTWMFVITILVVFGLSYEILGLCFGIGDQGKNYGYVCNDEYEHNCCNQCYTKNLFK